jgi:hypothetical protein
MKTTRGFALMRKTENHAKQCYNEQVLLGQVRLLPAV